MMVDPKDVAKIALEYSYPVWHILEEDYPDGMWEDLGRKFGLATVCCKDNETEICPECGIRER